MYREIKIKWLRRQLIQRNINLCGIEKENNLILIYELRKNGQSSNDSRLLQLAKIHEIWDLNQKYYSLRIKCSKKERDFILEYVNNLFPLSDLYPSTFFELDIQ